MWKKMMQIWLVGTAMSLGGVDGVVEVVPDAVAMRMDVTARDGTVGEVREVVADVAPPRPLGT